MRIQLDGVVAALEGGLEIPTVVVRGGDVAGYDRRDRIERQRVLRVLDQGLLEEFDRLQQAFFAALAQMVSTLQIQIVCGEVLCRSAAARARALGELRLESLHDRPGDPFLRAEQVRAVRLD